MDQQIEFSHPLVGHRVEVDYLKGRPMRCRSIWTAVAMIRNSVLVVREVGNGRGEHHYFATDRLTVLDPDATDAQRVTELGGMLQVAPKVAAMLAKMDDRSGEF